MSVLHAPTRRAGAAVPQCRPASARLMTRVATGTLALLTAMVGLAQEPAARGDSGAAAVTAPMVRSRLEQIETSSAHSDEVRTEAVDLYRQALANLEAADAHRAAATRFEQARVAAPQQTEEIRRELAAQADADPLEGLGADVRSTATDIEQQLQEERAAVAKAQSSLAELEQKLTAAETRPQAIRQRQSTIAQRVRELSSQIAEAPSDDAADIVTEAAAWARQTALQALTDETRKLDQELLSQPVRVALLEAQRDAATRDLERGQARVARLQTLLGERRRSETERVIAEVDGSPGCRRCSVSAGAARRSGSSPRWIRPCSGKRPTIPWCSSSSAPIRRSPKSSGKSSANWIGYLRPARMRSARSLPCNVATRVPSRRSTSRVSAPPSAATSWANAVNCPTSVNTGRSRANGKS
ncbi:MAG: hypothetical protein P8172_11330 [Gammaproteobacteria bacterium]